MIIDQLSNVQTYENISANLQKAFDYMKNTDLDQLKEGKYPIDGDKVFAIVSEYETKSLEEGAWEAHRKYMDVQYIISGKEKMGYAPLNEMKTTVEYDEEKDILFLEGEGDFVTVKEGMFAIFAPNDVHMPCIKIGESQHIKKLIVKVFVD